MGRVFREDIDRVVAAPELPWQEMRGATVLVTGATGLIGNALVHTLAAAGRAHGLELAIYTHGRNRTKGEALAAACGATFLQGDIRQALPEAALPERVDYIFHGAAVTSSAEMATHPLDVSETALLGTLNVLALAAEKRTRSMVYLSSMEVYGATDPALPLVAEGDLGRLELADPRSAYPQSKRMCESLCNSALAQRGVPVKTARPAQTFGAGAPKDDPRVFGQFSRSAVAREAIVLHTEGKSTGNYCYLSDTVRALVLLLLRGENGAAYNIVNPQSTVTIAEMARLVADDIGGGLPVVVRPPKGDGPAYAPDTGMRLAAGKMMALGWRPVYGLADMYRRMIADWQDNLDAQTPTGTDS